MFHNAHKCFDQQKDKMMSLIVQRKKRFEETFQQMEINIDIIYADLLSFEEQLPCHISSKAICAEDMGRRVSHLSKTIVEKVAEIKETSVDIICRIIPNDASYGTLKLTNNVGGVILGFTQLVHVFDMRIRDGNVLLVCIDPTHPDKEFWRYEVKTCNYFDPVVMSHTPMYYSGLYHFIFAVGRTVYVVHPHWESTFFDYVLSVTHIDIPEVSENSWISNITANQTKDNNCKYFFICSHDSTKVRKYSVFGEMLKIIPLQDLLISSGIIWFTTTSSESAYATICGGSPDIILSTFDSKANQCGSLLQATPFVFPKMVLWTGVGWLVLNMTSGKDEKRWNVAYYCASGDCVKICTDGNYDDETFPVSVAHCQYEGFVSFSRGNVLSFKF